MSNKKPSNKARLSEIERKIRALEEEKHQLEMDAGEDLEQAIEKAATKVYKSEKRSKDGEPLLTPRDYSLLALPDECTADERKRFARTLSGLKRFVEKNIGEVVEITTICENCTNPEYEFYQTVERMLRTRLKAPGIELTEYGGITLYTHGKVWGDPDPVHIVDFSLDPGDKLEYKSGEEIRPYFRRILLGNTQRRKR